MSTVYCPVLNTLFPYRVAFFPQGFAPEKVFIEVNGSVYCFRYPIDTLATYE
jgi:hypothetical protein